MFSLVLLRVDECDGCHIFGLFLVARGIDVGILWISMLFLC